MIRKSINCLLVIITLFFGFNITVFAKENNTIDFSRKGSIEITLHEMSEDTYVEGAEITLYKIADAYLNGFNLAFKYTNELSTCSVSLNDLTDTELVNGISKCNIDDTIKYKEITNQNGQVKFTDLDLGLYLVSQTNKLEGYSNFESFLVMTPENISDEWTYDIKANPKTDIYKVIDITVNKVWNTNDNKIPEKVDIELYRGDVLIDTIILNKDNNWTYTFKNLVKSDNYEIKEINIPKGYTVSYKENNYTFTVTNTDTLPDTGQIFYPIIISFVLGFILVLLGIRIIRNEA